MKIDPYVHAALVLKGVGKDVTKDNIISVLKAAGSEVDDAKAKVLEDALKDVDWEQALKPTAVAAPAVAQAGSESKPAESKKEPKNEEDEKKKEEEAAAGLANLFG